MQADPGIQTAYKRVLMDFTGSVLKIKGKEDKIFTHSKLNVICIQSFNQKV